MVIQAAMWRDIELSPPEQRGTIIAKVATIKTRSDTAANLSGVAAKRSGAEAHAAN